MLDNKIIEKAISAAVAAQNQPPELAVKLISWIKSLSEGNEQIFNKESYTRRCEHCFDAAIIHENPTA